MCILWFIGIGWRDIKTERVFVILVCPSKIKFMV